MMREAGQAGPNWDGELGNNGGPGLLTFQTIPNFKALNLSGGGGNFCAVRSDGVVVGWGYQDTTY